jgi:Tfp pilus assembly protein PilF
MVLFLLMLLVPAGLWARDNGSSWIEVRSEHFTVVTDGGDHDARRMLDQFERMRWVFQTLFPKTNVDPIAPIVVIAVRNNKEFQTMEPEGYQGKGKLELAGYFLKAPDKNYILLRLDVEGEHPYATVYHEYTHLELGTESMPLWLNEGLAQFFENTEFKDKEVLLGEPNSIALMTLQQNPLIPLDTLFRVDANSPYYHEEQKGSVFYAESWALTHYLEIADFNQKTNHLGQYLQLVSQHSDPVTAAERAFGDLKRLQMALSGYTNRLTYSQFRLNSAAAPIDPKSMTATPITEPQADAYRADVLAMNGRTADAQTLLDAILKVDPNNVLAHETMGFLAQRASKMDEAKKWYGQAVDLDSHSFLAQYDFGAISLMEGDTSQQTEASLRKAIQLNPRFAPAYDALAVLYARRKDNLDEAHMLSLNAVELEPGTTQYRMDAAYVLTQMGRIDDAMRVLELAKQVAKSPLEADVVQTRIAQLLQYQQQEQKRKEFNEQQQARAAAMGAPAGGQVSTGDGQPKHPSEKPHGPMLTAQGVLTGVTCSDPVVMELRVVGPKRTVSLYNNNYYDIDFTAANFNPAGELHPCKDIEGMKAKVQYFATADKTVDGQVVSIEMSK